MKYRVNTTPTFEKEFKRLLKRYPKIVDDFEALIDEIEVNAELGEPIQGVGVKYENHMKKFKIFKKRMPNTSAKQGKSGGFRVIIYLITSSNQVYLLDIYSKNEQENISTKDIVNLIKKNAPQLK
ncbi:type II toxin-antitoxin system RelE/ParE family toxin [Lysinibacillus sp. NPDC097279]|uniref:type II toxin-antitoxin system RelE/ParE family toxin n=1 Tax=Lysinibacillus sp. NPDC097279 TaxID=3364143 RepID=UPI00382B4949